MAPEQNSGRVTIAEQRWKYWIYLLVCLGLVLAGFLTFNARQRHWQFWVAETVMILFTLGLLYMLFNPRYRFVGRTGPKMDAYLAEQYSELLKEEGLFGYTQDGFTFKAESGMIEIQWKDISRISGHLEDVVTNDEDLCLKIEYGDNHFLEFDEEVPGWLLFRKQLQTQFNFSWEWQEKLLDSGIKEIEIYRRDSGK